MSATWRPGSRPRSSAGSATRDGFGREIQRKSQAAAGPVTEDGPQVRHRWIGSGWTVFNNKGQPVRRYEPFFTATPAFEFARAQGVSPVLFYDPPGRVVATAEPRRQLRQDHLRSLVPGGLGRGRHGAARPAG